MPMGLNSLYSRIIAKLQDLRDADLCKEVLAIILVVY